jgi:hypothetical protein
MTTRVVELTATKLINLLEKLEKRRATRWLKHYLITAQSAPDRMI